MKNEKKERKEGRKEPTFVILSFRRKTGRKEKKTHNSGP